jgi:predicted O-methyltransferase YrrM
MHKIKKLINSFDRGPLGIPFLDNRIEEMRNPQGHVADYYRFFYYLAKMLKPAVIVELGSWQGTSAAHFAAGSPSTKVITVDHHTDPGDQVHKAKTEAAAKEYDNLIYCQGWTCTEIYEEEKDSHAEKGENAFPKVMAALAGQKIDILFIDSWHVFKQAVRDWNAYKPYLAPGALVIVDDVLAGTVGSTIEGIDRFWNSLKGTKHLEGGLHAGYPMGFLKLKTRKK